MQPQQRFQAQRWARSLMEMHHGLEQPALAYAGVSLRLEQDFAYS